MTLALFAIAVSVAVDELPLSGMIRCAWSGEVVMDLSFSSSAEMMTICRRENVTSFMFLLSSSLFYMLIYCFKGRQK